VAVTQEEGGGAGSGGRGHVDAGRARWRLPGYHPGAASQSNGLEHPLIFTP